MNLPLTVSSPALSRTQIVRLHFTAAWKGGEGDMFFGSLAAIFDVFTPEEIGVDLRRLYSLCLVPGGFAFPTSCGVEISKVEVFRKKQTANQNKIPNFAP